MLTDTFPETQIDALTVHDLREAGSEKWTLYPNTIGAFIAEMDYGCPEPVKQALAKAVTAGNLGYLPQSQVELLAQSTTHYMERSYQWSIPAERVRPLADIVQAFQVYLQYFHTKGSAIIVPTPAYMPFLTVPQALGIPVIEVPMLRNETDWTLDIPAIHEAFEHGATSLILCHPHNPTGKVHSREELEEIALLVEDCGGRVFSDEIHAPILLDPALQHIPYAAISEVAAQHSITATSASKAFNIPGTKCCQMILTSDELFALWKDCGHWYEHQTSTLGVHATIAAYDHGQEWFAGALSYVKENLSLALSMIQTDVPAVQFLTPEATYLLWLDIRQTPLWQQHGSEDIAKAIRELSGVAITDGASCGAAGIGYIRVNTGMPRAILIEAMTRLGRALTLAPQSPVRDSLRL